MNLLWFSLLLDMWAENGDYLCNKFSCRQHQVGDFVDLFLFDGKVSETVLLGFSVASSLILGMLNYKMFHSYDVVFWKLGNLILSTFLSFGVALDFVDQEISNFSSRHLSCFFAFTLCNWEEECQNTSIL